MPNLKSPAYLGKHTQHMRSSAAPPPDDVEQRLLPLRSRAIAEPDEELPGREHGGHGGLLCGQAGDFLQLRPRSCSPSCQGDGVTTESLD